MSPQPEPVHLRTSRLEKYKCYIPLADKKQTGRDGDTDGDVESTEAEASVEPVETLLKPLLSQCIYRLEPYWSYEYCHGKHVRQCVVMLILSKTDQVIRSSPRVLLPLTRYHEDVVTMASGEKSKKLSEHFLGYADATQATPDKATAKFMYKGKSTVYHTETFGGGDTCDLTLKPRTTEIRFVCDPNMMHAFESISETSTCNYLVIIHTSMVCSHPDFTAEALVTTKALCVGEQGAPVKPTRLSQLEHQLAAEEKARETEAAKNQAMADAQHADHLAQQQQKKQQKGSEQKRAKHQQGGANEQAAIDPKAQAQAAKQLLTRFFQGKQCFGGGQGWWQHEFCYMKHVKQVHFNADGSRDEVLMGKWDMAFHTEKIAAAGGHKSQNSMTHYYGNGDFCDEIGEPRQAKVKMMCSRSLTGTQVALTLHETSTCKVKCLKLCTAVAA